MCVRVCAQMRILERRREEEGWVGDTKHCLIFDKQRGLLCAAAVWHIFSRLLCWANSWLLPPQLPDLDERQVMRGSLPRYRLAISAT